MMAKLFSNERFYAVLVFLPIVALAIIFVLGFAERRTASTWSNNSLLELREDGYPVDNQSLSDTCLANASSEHTDELLKMLSVQRAFSHDALSMKLKDAHKVTGKEEPWDAKPFAEAISPEKAVVVDKILKLGELEKPIWLPVYFDGFSTMLPNYQQSRSLIRRCDEQFRHHFHKGDHEAAIEDLRAMDLIRKQIGKPPFVVVYLINIAFSDVLHRTIGDSLAMDQWSETELDQLRELVSQDMLREYDWPTVVYGEFSSVLSTLGVQSDKSGGGLQSSQSINFNAAAPFGVSPIHVRQLLRYSDELASISATGDDRFEEAIREVQTKYRSDGSFRASHDSSPGEKAIAVVDGPFASDHAMGSLVSYWRGIGAAISRVEMTRKATLTAIGIKQYQLQTGKWPEAFTDLKDVGLTRSDYQFKPNRDFGYALPMKKGDGVWLWTPGWNENDLPGVWNPDALPDDALDEDKNMRTAIQIR